MTMPSGSDPSGYDASGDGSLVSGGMSALAGRTEVAVRASKQLELGNNSTLNGVLELLFDGLRDGVSFALAIVEKIVNGLIGGAQVAFGTLQQALSALTSFATNVIRAAQAAINQIGDIVNGLFVVPINSAIANFASWFQGLIGWQSHTAAQLTEHTEAIANLNDIAAASNTTVAYVGDLQDMVTAPRSLLVAFTSNVTNGMRCGDNAHTHNYTIPCISPAVTVGSSVGNIYYTPIVVDRNGTLDKLRWIVGADTSLFAIDYYEVALCVYNPNSKAIEKVWGSGNIKDTTAATTTLTEVELPMNITQKCAPGQVLFFAHQQVAPGLFQGSRAFAAVPQGNIGRPVGMLLNAASYAAINYSQGIPSSILLSSLTRENRFIPWGAVSVLAPTGEAA